MESWSQFVRANFGLLVLFALVLVMLSFMLHVTHDRADASMLSWGREQTSLVLGGLLGLITGRMTRGDGSAKPPEDKP